MATIRDVAKLAGVSPITVSRVINNTSYVSQETRERVEAAIDELGYVPNMLGPSLRLKKTMTLAAVISDITNPFWTDVTRGIEDIAQAHGYFVILCNTDESEDKQEQYLQMLLRRRIDGILLVPASSTPDSIRLIKKQNIPVVVLDRRVPDIDVDFVRADSETGAYELTKYLISLGHRQIAMLAGPQSVSTSIDRVNGFCRALNEIDLEMCDPMVFWGSFTKEAGYEMAKKAIAATPPPTALFAANNFVAIGAIQALQEKNLRIPEDFSIVAFDDIPAAYSINPFLTAANQPSREMGKRATRLLLDRINGKDARPCQEILLSTEMIIRSSAGKSVSG
jgi:LacI family transcriptional regulator